MRTDPTSVVREYFARMRAGDPSVVELFHPEARVRGLGAVRSGRKEIEAFYRDTMEQARPSPRQAGALMAEGSRVAAEILIDIGEGLTIHVVDLFEVESGLILSLTYFLADHPPESGETSGSR